MPTSDIPKLKELFRSLTKQIHLRAKSKKKVVIDDSGDTLMSYVLNDLVLYVDMKRRETVAIEFETFNKTIYFTPDGEFQVAGKDDEVMVLDNPEVVKIMSGFLEWRLMVTRKLRL